MGFWKNINDVRFIEEEIVHFEIYEHGYYAVLERGGRLDITRAFHLQPPIDDPEDYHAFMFVETQQGFFLLRQRVVGNITGAWEVYIEIGAGEPHLFYNEVYNYWWKVRGSLGQA